MSRLSVTARIALLAIALALASNLALTGVLWHATHDDAIDLLRRDTVEQADALAAVHRAGGVAALRQALAQARQPDDDSLIGEVVDAKGRRLAGYGPERTTVTLATTDFQIGPTGAEPPWAGQEAGYAVRRIGPDWLVSGRLLDDWERAQRTIGRALALAALLSLVLGVAGGLVLTRYVVFRLRRIAATVDRVAAGDLTGRVARTASHDAFDELAGRINTMLDKIERLMAELRLVTDSIAHDLRSPLARLHAKVEGAVAGGDPAALAGVLGDTEVVMRMLATLLEISRAETVTEDRFTLTDPAALMRDLAELYDPAAEEAGMAVRTAIAATPELPLHAGLVSQAIANLVDNAMKHGASGGELVLAAAADAGAVRLTVADRGPGIATDQRAAALRRFGRLDGARRLPGAGLGLTLVEAVARQHGGWLELADHAPGLAATLVLPLARQPAPWTGGTARPPG